MAKSNKRAFNIEFCPGVDFDTTDCHAMGWGKDAFGDADGYQEYNQFLRSVKLKIVDHDTCQEGLRSTRLRDDFELDPSFVCAGGGEDGRDVCEGDGGGPLVCKAKRGENFILAGIGKSNF